MAGRRLRGFVGPKTYDPSLAQVTATAPTRSHEEMLRQQLGLPDDSDASDSGSVSGGSVDSRGGGGGGGGGVSQSELDELREQLAEAQQTAAAAEKKAAADVKAMQWRMRTSLLASKKAIQAKADLITEMIDAMYDLEKEVEKHGGTPERVWSEYYEEKNESGGGSGGASSPTKRPSKGAADSPESKADGAGEAEGVDVLEVLALKKEVKGLKDALESAREQVARGQARQAKLTTKLDEARKSLANGGGATGGAANGSSGGGASSEELADALDAAQAAQADAKKLGKKLASAEEQRAAAVHELKDAKSSAADLQQQVDSLNAQLQSVSSGGDAATAASAAAAKQVDALKAEREALEQRVQALEEEVAAARDAADEAAAGKAKADKALAKAQTRLSAAQGEAETLRARNTELDAKLQQMSETMSAAAGEAEAVLQKQLDQTRGELEAARVETKEAQDANNANIEAAQQALATWKEKYTALKADRKQLKQQLQQAAAELQTLDASVAESSARASDLEKKLASTTAELERRSQDAASAAGSASKLEARISELTAEVAESKQRMAALQSSNAEAIAKADAESKAQIEELHKQHDDERQQIIDILKNKYTKRIDKWKARASSSQALLTSHRKFRSGMRETLSSFRREVAADFGDLNVLMQSKCHKLARAAKTQTKHLGTVLEKYRKESKLRKKLHNEIMEMRGNIRVFARVRPVVPKEDQEGAVMVAKFPAEATISMVNSKRLQKEWEFDHVFRPEHTNADVFEQCRDLLTSVVDGYNVCIFAYGQTGAGKTHTMGGSSDNPGLNFRTLNLLFELSEERSEMWDFDISMSLLEIYNETIADLLSTQELSSKLAVKRGEHGNYVPGLTEVPVHSCEQVLELMRRGYDTRTTFATNSNEHSSRSHCILSVHVVARNKHTNMVARGKLHLVDLAGSERVGKSGATGARLKEAQAINKSLSALGNVIASRAAKNSHTPFRDSVLTYLLEDSLSKQSKTLMFVNLSPVSTNADESFCSLNFAARVRTVELGRASKNVSGERSSSRNSRPSSRNSRK